MGIQTLSGDSLGLNTIVGESKVDLIIGGPPCQAYSIAGRVRDKRKDDYRNFFFV
jgi:DNA (cytosine-5)-methyltransferase 1